MTAAASSRSADCAELDQILVQGSIVPLFQPIVSLESGAVVGYEALARGPRGSSLEMPGSLFGLAMREGKLEELDRVCRIAALGASRGTAVGSSALFVNVEPSASVAEVPGDFCDALSGGELRVVFELTERALTDRPAQVLRAVDELRALGAEIALDDVGVDPRSLALMPFLLPEIIKLDMSLLHGHPSESMARTMHAVGAHAQRTGAIVLAEGIETDAHLERALALGATHGQGWRFGRPAPPPELLLPGRPSGEQLPRRAEVRPATSSATPFQLVSRSGRRPRTATKQLLLSLSRQLERQAEQMGEECVVLASLQHRRHLTAATQRRYERLAEEAAFVALIGSGVVHDPATGLRGADLEPGEALADEWNVCVVGPHFAAAMVAFDLGGSEPDHDRGFRYHLTYDRGEVTAAAQSMMARVANI